MGITTVDPARYDRIVEIVIRPGTAVDVPAVLSLWQRADAEPSHTDDVPSLIRLIAHDAAALLLAEHGGRAVGSVIAGWVAGIDLSARRRA